MSFEPINELEKVLIKASTEIDMRPEFYRILKLSDVFIIGIGPQPNEEGIIGAGQSIAIQKVEIGGKVYLAAFTSKEQLSKTLSEETQFYKMKFDDLLNLIGDTEIAINPYLEYGKILSIDEVKGLRDGSLWKPKNRMVVQKETKVMIGQPQNPPTKLLDALRKYFEGQDSVKAAYNVHYFNPETDKKPHTLICVEAPVSEERISSEIGMIVADIDVPDPPVDVIFINRYDGFGKSVSNSFKPFYSKRHYLFNILKKK